MTCPRCGRGLLVVSTLDGVVIDRCGSCRGVWLDAGELDRLLAQAWTAALDEAERPVAVVEVVSR